MRGGEHRKFAVGSRPLVTAIARNQVPFRVFVEAAMIGLYLAAVKVFLRRRLVCYRSLLNIVEASLVVSRDISDLRPDVDGNSQL
jgi:hypothetical protein